MGRIVPPPPPGPKGLEQRIKDFAESLSNQQFAAGVMKYGHEKGDKPETVMARLIAHILLAFHGIPIKKDDIQKN